MQSSLSYEHIDSYVYDVSESAYQPWTLRLDDIEDSQYHSNISLFLSKVEAKNIIISQEISKEVKKPHKHFYYISNKGKKYQQNQSYRIFGVSHPKDMRALRECKDVKKYISYIVKDGDVIHTDFTSSFMSSIPTWVDDKEFKKDNIVNDIIRHIDNTSFGKEINEMLQDDVLIPAGDALRLIRNNVCEGTLNYYQVHNKVYNIYYIKNLVYTISQHYANMDISIKERYLQFLKNKILD